VFSEAKDDGSGGDNWSYRSCKAPVKSSPPTNQHPAFCTPDALPDTQPTVSEHWREIFLKHVHTVTIYFFVPQTVKKIIKFKKKMKCMLYIWRTVTVCCVYIWTVQVVRIHLVTSTSCSWSVRWSSRLLCRQSYRLNCHWPSTRHCWRSLSCVGSVCYH